MLTQPAILLVQNPAHRTGFPIGGRYRPVGGQVGLGRAWSRLARLGVFLVSVDDFGKAAPP